MPSTYLDRGFLTAVEEKQDEIKREDGQVGPGVSAYVSDKEALYEMLTSEWQDRVDHHRGGT